RHDADIGGLEPADHVQQRAEAIFEEHVELAHARPIAAAGRAVADACAFVAAEAHGERLSDGLRPLYGSGGQVVNQVYGVRRFDAAFVSLFLASAETKAASKRRTPNS